MTSREGSDFGMLAVAMGFLTRDDLEKILRTQSDLRKIGVDRRLGELLLERKMMSRDQVLLVLRAQGKRILVCHGCKKSYNIHHYRATEAYACKHCGGELHLPGRTAGTSVHDSITVTTSSLKRKSPKAGPKDKVKISPQLAHLLPGYLIVERIGQGGMGTVYKARDLIGGRTVAVKLLAPFLASDEEYVKRFFVEARNLQRLNHPNIVKAYDAGEQGDHKFFIMEFVDGSSLEDVIERRKVLSEGSALEITRQVAQGLDYAWALKIIHRDIKPQNIMITAARAVKLCDLGLSKDVTSDVSLTMTGSVNCSPPYASPEQAQGLKGVDVRSDVYSLGVSLYQMTTGALPFKGSSPGQFLLQHVTEKAPNPLVLNPRLTPPVAKMILRMLEKDPAARPFPIEVAKACTKLLNGAVVRDLVR